MTQADGSANSFSEHSHCRRAALGSRTRRMLAAGVFLAFMLSTVLAPAYVRTRRESDGKPVRWAEPHVVFALSLASIPSGLDPLQVQNAFRQALAAWSRGAVGCTGLVLELSITTDPEPQIAHDGVNRIVFRNDRWAKNGDLSPASAYDREEMAVTSVYVQKAEDDPQRASIIEADIELNALDYRWTAGEPRSSSAGGRDIAAVVMHELGHALGLEHNCNDGSSNNPALPRCRAASKLIRAATMFPSWLDAEGNRRLLGSDERRAACDIYPNSASAPVFTSSSASPIIATQAQVLAAQAAPNAVPMHATHAVPMHPNHAVPMHPNPPAAARSEPAPPRASWLFSGLRTGLGVLSACLLLLVSLRLWTARSRRARPLG